MIQARHRSAKLGPEAAGRAAARAAAALLALALLAAGAGARAERSDRHKPVNLEADRLTIDDAKQLAVFEGNVTLTQGTLQIRGDRMEVRQDKDGFRHGITWGRPAYFRQKREGHDEYIEGWAERIEYDGRAETMQMFNRAHLKRGQDEVRGSYISYDAKTEFYRVLGGAGAADSNNPEGRVRAVIQPKSKEKPPASPPLTLKPADSVAAPRADPPAVPRSTPSKP